MTTSNYTTSTHQRINGSPADLDFERLRPWPDALSILIRLVQTNDPAGRAVLTLFKTWLQDRDQPISVQQALYLWDRFFIEFAIESSSRFTQWLLNPMSTRTKNPVAVGRMMFQIWKATHFRAWSTRMKSTFLGRRLVEVVTGLGYLAAFLIVLPFCFVAVGFLAWGLERLQDPARTTLTQILSSLSTR
jgi:hypothetical protein